MARDIIEAPPATPPRYSLLIAAPTAEDSARWQAGVRFAPEGCGNSGRVAVDCFGSTDLLDPDANPAEVTADAFGVWAADQCSTFGFRARDYVGRARRQLEATQSFQIAEETWGGSLVGDPILLGSSEVNANLPLNAASSDTVTDGATSATGAVGALVGALGACGEGRQGMIHVTPQVLVQLAAVDAIYRDSGLWYTPMGHLVVADDGYDGSGPGGVPATDSQWMYATSMMRIRLSPIEIIPDIGAEDPDGESRNWQAALDPYTNLVTVFAQRLALVQWDRCCHFAAEVNLSPPLTGGGS